ncbi:MAG: glycerol kinase GlpK [Thermoplasmatota archaeon]
MTATGHHILALDAGTTGVTALVFDQDRVVVGRAYQEFTQHYPEPGWVEHDAAEIWDVTLAVARHALVDADIEAEALAGIGITNQRETTVLWDRATGEPVHRAIVWQDNRTEPQCAKLRRKWAKKVQAKTGLVLDPYFSASKLAWLLTNVPAARERAKSGKLAFGTIDSWLLWKLTGGTAEAGAVHATDHTNASRTNLWNIHVGDWDDELMELWSVPRACLPDVRPSGHLYGAATALGGAPVASLVGDQQAALFGQGCTRPGETKNTYGTGCFLLQHTGDKPVASKNGLLTTRAASLDETPQYALEGSVFVAGAAIQWLRDGLGTIPDAPAISTAAQEVEDAGGVVVVPAFAGLGAPHWDAEARGAIMGVTRGTTAAHLARATLEGIALQAHEVLRAMEKDSKNKVPVLRVDGGATKSDLLMQLQADLLGASVERPDDVEATAKGAALLAGIAVGLWSLDDARAPTGVTTFKPKAKRSWVKGKEKDWKRAVKAVQAFT